MPLFYNILIGYKEYEMEVKMELNKEYLENQEFAEGKTKAQQELSDKTATTKRELEEEIEERQKEKEKK